MSSRFSAQPAAALSPNPPVREFGAEVHPLPARPAADAAFPWAGTAAKESGNLDVLRAYAVLLVLGVHLWFTINPQLTELSAAAHLGVVAFFVHTAFVLMRSLERLADDRRGSVVRRFYIRRFFRIYPLAAVCVLVVVAASIPWLPWLTYTAGDGAGWKRIAANLALVQNVGFPTRAFVRNLETDQGSVLAVLWSLPFEVQMYALLPLCFFVVKRYSIVGAGCLWGLGVAVAFVPPLRHLTIYFPCFLSGVLGYAISRRCRPVIDHRLWPVLLGVTVIGFAINKDYANGISDWVAALALGALVPLVKEGRKSLPLYRGSYTIAKYSYGIYLAHTPIMWLSFAVLSFQPRPLQWAVFIAMTFALPVILFHTIEQPMINLGARLADRLAARRQPARVEFAGFSHGESR